ncbi:CPBP family intramembrane glutamic endopeptidase [Archangium primigenium]|uniref:CPBP family intramembrane glutamic endopeptidase n=1 Tax=[Archangium] primigenium TaxID=2792470 RepID=UPI001956477F|nr:CPBP family intramembrane glutamic endopeptidase [Archangium primigenium]MBM7113782.1 CPBP family intramembrane metalloprotease [Archangium primigenium]
MTDTREDRRLGWLVASGLAVLGWTALVRWNPPHFYAWASLTCGVLAGLSLLALGQRTGRALLTPRGEDVLWGVTFAGVLYVGSRVVLWALCGGLTRVACEPLRDIYAGFGRSGWGAAVALVFVLTPAEELFWRGVVQGALRPRLGSRGAVVVAAVLSSLVLLFFQEPLLALAALPTSLAWGLLAEWRKSLVASWVSHALWDVLIIVLLPVG